jgi:hypothetical protein
MSEMLQDLTTQESIYLQIICAEKYSAFAQNENIYYTLLPRIDECIDFSFFDAKKYADTIISCLNTIGLQIPAYLPDLSANFISFALDADAFDCI